MSFRSISRSINTYVYRRPLVGPSDPVSNLRPVLYAPRADIVAAHPYSLAEFDGELTAKQEESDGLYWRLQQERLDAFNHDFWVDNNVRFEAGRQVILDAHPPLLPSASSEVVAARERSLEAAFSQFYAAWIDGEGRRFAAYTKEWNRKNYGAIGSALRQKLHDAMRWIGF